MWCLTGKLADKFLNMLRDGTITPEQLSGMTSAERHTFFSNSFGETNAQSINAQFESKLLLKNQQQGIINWAKRTGGLKPEVQRDILSRVQRMDRILQPDELTGFLGDLAGQKLGMGITMQEAGKIVDLAKNIQDKKANIPEGVPDGHPTKLDYGASKWTFDKYIGELKTQATKQPFGEYIKKPIGMVSDLGGLAKSLKSTLDDSYQFRQGLKVFLTHPIIWERNFTKSFSLIKQELSGGKDVMGGIMADIYSRDNAVNGNYGKWKLDLGINEEQFPTSLPEKMPVLGRVYKAAETAFTATARKTRADLADYYLNVAKRSGADVLTEKADAESFGKFVNSLTSRGYLGRLEPMGKISNNIFFSVRNQKANIDFLTAHQFQKGVSPFVRKQAAINLLKAIGGIGAVLTVANAVRPGSVEKDPRSSDFGKIKIGDTRFDVTGGMSSLVTLASRLVAMSTKSSTTGKVSSLWSGKFGASTGKDVVYNFFENKLSPAAGEVRTLLKGTNFQGNKPTLQGEVYNFLTPMIITDYVDLQTNPNSADIIASMIADALGIGVNTYTGKPQKQKSTAKNWTDFVK